MGQWLSNFGLYQNHLTDMLKHILFGPLPGVGLGQRLKICVFHPRCYWPEDQALRTSDMGTCEGMIGDCSLHPWG